MSAIRPAFVWWLSCLRPSAAALGITLLLLNLGVVCAAPLDVWHQRNPLPQGNHLGGITFGNGRFVAVGDQGTVLTSTDGTNWAVGNVHADAFLRGITFGAGTFVAVGGSMIYTSSDGMSWTTRNPGPNDGMRAIGYGNGRFMAVGGDSLSRMNLATSTNLVDWSVSSTRLPYPHRAIAFGGGVFMVVTDEGEWGQTIDGLSGMTIGGYGTFDDLIAVAYGNGGFLAAGTGGRVYNNPFPKSIGATNTILGLLFVQGAFFAVGAGGIIARSPDAVSWSILNSGITTPLRSIAFGNGLFAAVGDAGRIVTSLDGTHWTVRSRGPINTLHRLAESNSRLVAVGNAGAIITSTTGSDWSLQDSGTTASLVDVCVSGGRFVAIGNSSTGAVAVASSDGTNWLATSLGKDTTINRVAANSDMFVAVGYVYDFQHSAVVGRTLFSTDGVGWTALATGTNSALNAITYGGGQFVGVGGPLSAVTYGAGRFIATGNDGPMLISTNGISWDTVTPGPPEWLDDVVFANGLFVAKSYASLYSSTDGQQWIAHALPPSFQSGNLSAGPTSFFLVGTQGTILESDPLVRLTLASGSARLMIYGPQGRFCRIDSADDLSSADAWQAQTSVLLTNSAQTWLDPRPAAAARFYRTALLP